MTSTLTEIEKQLIYSAFYKHVNLSPKEMEAVVGADPVEAPAAPEGEGSVVPAESPAMPFEATEEQRIGRHLVRIKRMKKEELNDVDYVQMRNAVNYIRRHSAHPPKDEAKQEDWRLALMARGFDPHKQKPKPAIPFIEDPDRI